MKPRPANVSMTPDTVETLSGNSVTTIVQEAVKAAAFPAPWRARAKKQMTRNDRHEAMASTKANRIVEPPMRKTPAQSMNLGPIFVTWAPSGGAATTMTAANMP